MHMLELKERNRKEASDPSEEYDQLQIFKCKFKKRKADQTIHHLDGFALFHLDMNMSNN